ncbi:MAG: hypothetical protein M1821_000556 [Bathelium mastoideum]|nr:MAG: hypothetical protein M1821_000556 [Bathelium mastoideum]KAI9683021.1 MAG: hypothetical protein M1822_006214 [Bathelium mastoideum]
MITLRFAALSGLAYFFNLDAAYAYTSSPEQIVQDLKGSLSPGSEVVLTSDPAFAKDFTARFSESHSPGFVVGAKPAFVTDVQKVVQYASRNNLSFLATGGGHGYTWSLGRLQNAIQLDMGNFQTIDIDSASNTMTIGGGVRIENVTQELQAVGREFPVGTCGTVGVTGFTLGGGVGPLGGLYGTASDNLLSVEMVTGTGEILDVSATSHPDLFYGVRGAGFNYGIATSLQYRTFPATNEGRVTVINAMFPGPTNRSVWEAANSFVGQQPPDFSILFAIRFNETMGGMTVVGSFIFLGNEDQTRQVAKPFLDLNPLYVETFNAAYDNFSLIALYNDISDIGPRRGINLAPFTINLYKVDVDNLVSVMDFMNMSLTQNSDLQAATLSWAQYSSDGFLSYPLESSAFAYRDVAIWFSIDGFSETVDQLPLLAQFGSEVRSRVQQGSGRPDLETYVHFSHGDEGPEAWYTKGKLPGLSALKPIYDPQNLFVWYNPVPSSWSRY